MQDVKIKFAYKKGFRRLFLVSAAAWGLLVLVGAFNRNDHSFSELLLIWFIPLAIIYVGGIALVWILEGFAKPE